MSMRINASVPSFYNAGSVDNLRVNPVEKVNPVEEVKKVQSLTEQQRAGILSEENRGVVQTRVSPDNAFQKTMVNDPSFAYERMAGKLLDKLPNILRDIQNLPEDDAFAAAIAEKAVSADAAREAAPAKVIISEDGRVNGQPAEAPAIENISL